MYQRVSFETAKQIIDSEQNHLILDVREEEEYITGHASDAVLFPLDSIDQKTAVAKIPSKDTALLLYCRTGSRSYQAAMKLLDLGYTKVYDIGSLVGWPYGILW